MSKDKEYKNSIRI